MRTGPVSIGILCLLVALLVQCVAGVCGADDRTGFEPGRVVFDRTADKDDVLKILVYYDMEGIAGQNILTSIDFPRPEYFEARELLTNDVNAVIDGLFAGGADSVYVVDAHGSFNPEPDIVLERMDPRAKMLYRNEKFHPYVDLIEGNTFDAIVAVAMHSRTGGGGFGEHTVNLGTDWILNGRSVTESDILAFSWGRIGIPLILVSGDDKLAEQIAWMDWIEYVTAKEAIGIDDAVLFPVDSVHKQLTASAKRAVEDLDQMKATSLTSPITAALQVSPPADLSVLRRVPGLHYDDQKVTFQAGSFEDAYEGMRGLLDVAQSGYYQIAAGLFLGQGGDTFQQFKDAIFATWKQSAPGRTTAETTAQEPPQQSEQTAAPARRYFGAQ